MLVIVIVVSIIIVIISVTLGLIFGLKKSNPSPGLIRTQNTSPQKYFHEVYDNPHLDYRFGSNKKLSLNEINDTLLDLLKFFVSYCKNNDIKPVLMYGALIGYHFNNKMLPWDDDIDMILTEPYISKLKNYENKDFIIDINPNYNNYSVKDTNNLISARVINKKSGVFIDILFHKKVENYLICKDRNNYRISDIYPIKSGLINNIPVYVPNKIKNVLKQRYGKVHVEKSAGVPTNRDDWILIDDKYWLK